MKVGLVAASLVLVVGSATGCSNSPSTEDFCGAYKDFQDSLVNIDSEDPADFINALKDSAEEFGDVGTPDDMSDEAKDGFELIIDSIDGLDEDSTLEDLGQVEDDFSEEEQKNSQAFQDYLTKECPAGE